MPVSACPGSLCVTPSWANWGRVVQLVAEGALICSRLMPCVSRISRAASKVCILAVGKVCRDRGSYNIQGKCNNQAPTNQIPYRDWYQIMSKERKQIQSLKLIIS